MKLTNLPLILSWFRLVKKMFSCPKHIPSNFEVGVNLFKQYMHFTKRIEFPNNQEEENQQLS